MSNSDPTSAIFNERETLESGMDRKIVKFVTAFNPGHK